MRKRFLGIMKEEQIILFPTRIANWAHNNQLYARCEYLDNDFLVLIKFV